MAVSLMLIYLMFSAGKGPKSCCPDANSEKSCCQNSTAVFKITNNYSSDISIPHVPQSKLVAFAQKVFSLYDNSINSYASNLTIDVHGVKHLSKIPIYLTNRVFII